MLSAFGLLLLAVLLMTSCGEEQQQPSSEQPSSRLVFTYSETVEVDSLDPAEVSSGSGVNIARFLFDGLVRLDPENGEVVPGMAEEWEVEKGATQITFRLREGAKFSSGEEITADDFIYSWQRALKTGGPDSAAAIFLEIVQGVDAFTDGEDTKISGVKAIDDYTLQVTLTEPMIEFVSNTAHPALAPVPKNAAEEKDFAENPVGNGPFKLKEIKGDSEFILEKNPDYYGEPAKVDEVVMKVIEDPEKAAEELKSGEIDAMVGIKVEDAALADKLREEESLEFPEFDLASFLFVGMNVQQAPWNNNVKLRQALNWAVDRESLVKVSLDGFGEPAKGIVPPTVPGSQKNAMAYGYDPARAKALLAEAGYPNGQGLPALTMMHSDLPTHALAAQELQKQFAEVGVKVTLSEQPDETMALGGSNQYNLFVNSYSPLIPTTDGFLFAMFHSSYAGRDNETNYANPEVDAMMNAASASATVSEEYKLYNQAEKKILDDAPVVPLFFQKVLLPHSDRVTKIMRDNMGDIVLDRVEVKAD